MSSFDEKILNVVSDLAATNNPFKDKWVTIIGDSISTYTGYIPEGHTTYYPNGDVTDVSKTWWHILLTKLGAKLCVNESWSGRRVCMGESEARGLINVMDNLKRVAGTEYTNLDGTTEIATKDISPDIILINVGINDFGNGEKLGEIVYESSTGSYTTDSGFIPAYLSLLINIIVKYPKAKVYLMNILPAYDKLGFRKANANGARLIDYREAIDKMARLYESSVIHLDRFNLTAMNIGSYTSDKLHPNAKLMNMIANQCYTEMMSSNVLLK